MTTTANLFVQTQLAEAAYADFSKPQVAPITALQQENSKFSLSQATSFVNEWAVVDHVPDTTSGFSATIFRHRQTGAYTLSIRGTLTSDPVDILNDINIITGDGVAVAQLIDL